MQIVEKMNEKANRLHEMIEGLDNAVKDLTGNRNNSTLTDKRALLLDHEGRSKNIYRVKKNKNTEPT